MLNKVFLPRSNGLLRTFEHLVLFGCHGDANGKMSRGCDWEDRVGGQDCMQSRQDYIIAVKEKRRDTNSEEDSPGVRQGVRSYA